jgi:hypothetical protein
MVSQNNLKQLGLATHNFADAFHHFPNGGGYDYSVSPPNSAPYTTPNAYTFIPGYGEFRPRWGDPSRDGRYQLGSAHYSLLPYMEQGALFQSPLACFSTAVKSYYMPVRRSASLQTVPVTDDVYPGWSYNDAGLGANGRTDYAANDQVFFTTYAGWGRVSTHASIIDGASNTIFFGEKAMSSRAVSAGSWYWDEPVVMGGTGGTGRCGDELYSDSQLNSFPDLVSGPGWSVGNESCGGGNWGTPASAGPQFVFGDGSVRTIRFSTPPAMVRLMIRPADGQVVVFD